MLSKVEKSESKAKLEDDLDEETDTDLTKISIILHSLLSNCENYFNNTRAYNAIGFYLHKAQILNKMNSSERSNKVIHAGHAYSFEEFLEAVDMYSLTDRTKCLGTGLTFSLNGKRVIEMFS